MGRLHLFVQRLSPLLQSVPIWSFPCHRLPDPPSYSTRTFAARRDLRAPRPRPPPRIRPRSLGTGRPHPIGTFWTKRGSDAFAIVTARWRHGDLGRYPEAAGHPRSRRPPSQPCRPGLRDLLRPRHPRALSCAPAFGPMVAEMALALTLASARNIVDAHIDFRAGRGTSSCTRATWGRSPSSARRSASSATAAWRGNCARLLEPFGCTIQVYDPWLPETYLREQGVERRVPRTPPRDVTR